MSASNSSRPSQYLTVTPAKAGVQGDRHILATLDPSPDLIRGSRRDDEGTKMGLIGAIALAAFLLLGILASLPASAEEQPSAAAMAKAREVVAASMVPGSQEQMIGGISASIGQIAIREASFAFTGNGKSAVVYPLGGNAPLTMTVANFGGQDDKLTGASSP